MPFDLEAKPKKEQIKWSSILFILLSWSFVIWYYKSTIRVSKY